MNRLQNTADKRQMQNLDSIDLSATQRRAVMKLAVELVKADDRIHSKEVAVLDKLQSGLGLDQEELDLTHYLSLESAVDCLKNLEEEPTRRIINLFNEIMCSDNDIDFEENLLLSSISMSCDSGSRDWCRILSADAAESEAPEKQIVFLEGQTSEAAHLVLDDKYDNLLIQRHSATSESSFSTFRTLFESSGNILRRMTNSGFSSVRWNTSCRPETKSN